MTVEHPQPFDVDNKAWLRFLALAGEHFETLRWESDEGRPRWVSLVDRASGHVVTLAPYDSSEQVSPVVVLAMSTVDDSLTAAGPYPGALAGNYAASQHAVSDSTVAATCSTLLHPPADGGVPVDGWLEVPEWVVEKAWAPSPPESGSVVLVLLDRGGLTTAVVGPFDDAAAARAWRTDQHNPDRYADRLIIAITDHLR